MANIKLFSHEHYFLYYHLVYLDWIADLFVEVLSGGVLNFGGDCKPADSYWAIYFCGDKLFIFCRYLF